MRIFTFFLVLLLLIVFDRPSPAPETPIDPPKKEEEKKEKGWDERVVWTEHPVQKVRINEDSFYADVINHTIHYQRFNGVMTDAHENTHDINNYFMNKFSKTYGGHWERRPRILIDGRYGWVDVWVSEDVYGDRKEHYGFYVGGGKAMVIREPRIRKSMAAEFIPANLRGFRFRTYVTGQREWDDRGLYLFDEGTAYVNGALAAMDYVKRGKSVEKSDVVRGPLEFAVYTTAVAMATEKYDPDYFKSYDQFKAGTAWFVKKALDVYRKGKGDFPFSGQEEYYEQFSRSELRRFLDRIYGDRWVRENLFPVN